MNPRIIYPLMCASLVATTNAQPTTTSFEQGVIIHASELVPAESLRGNSFRVRDQVQTDGFMAHFEIDSDFGLFTATGVPQLKARTGEIEAIRKLVETSKSDLFAEGLKRSIDQPIDAVKRIVHHPTETVKQAPKTVGHFFGKIGHSIERTANKVADRTSGDQPPPDAGEIGRGIGNTAKSVAGFDQAKLDTAKQLGVDPYADNDRLQDEMDRVTWAFFAGGMPIRIGATIASAGVALTATKMAGIPEDTYALTRSEIAMRDQQALEAIGVKADDVKKFMIKPTLGTTRRHRIVRALESMPHLSGRGLIIRLAHDCQTSDQADFLTNAVCLLADHQPPSGVSYSSLKVIGRLPTAVTTTGELWVPAPVDHVTWTQEVAGFAQRDDLGTTPRTLIHTGKFSAAATAGFTAAGWKLIEIAYP